MIAVAGKTPPSKVFDATGKELSKVVWCDTETGEVEQVVLTPDGKIVIGDTSMRRLTERKFYPAPLRLERI